METPQAHPQTVQGIRRREILKAGLVAGAALSTWSLSGSPILWGAEAGQPKRGGILRVRGYDPPHFDPHLTQNFKTHWTLSFVYSKLVRHKVGAGVQPSTFTVEPDLAERWETPDDTTYVFHLRQGVKWHNKPPVNGRELVAEDVKYTFDRFLTIPGNPLRAVLEPVDRVEVVDRYTVKFLLKEPFVWLVHKLANTAGWIIAREAVEHYGDLKQPEAALGTGPFLLEHYEPNVKTVFKRNPAYFRKDQPYVDGVEWLVLDDDATGLAMYRTGQIDAAPWLGWTVRQADLEGLKQSHPHLMYQDFLAPEMSALYMRTDQPPFNDVRVRRAISQAVDRQAIIDAVYLRGAPPPAIPRGLVAWSLPIDQLGPGAKYYQYNPQEARRLLAEAGFPNGLKTSLNTTGGFGRDVLDAAQLMQQYFKAVGIEVELKLQEFGAYAATTRVGKFEGLAYAPFLIALEPDQALYYPYAPDQPLNPGHVNDPKITAMLKEQRRTQELDARKKIIGELQRYMAEQQYYVYMVSLMVTASWQPYVKNYAPNFSFDYGSRAAALWLER